MSAHRVTVSDDGTTIAMLSDCGRRAELRSSRRGGFTADQIERARTMVLNPQLVAGQTNRTWHRIVAGRAVYIAVNTGPPTWWRPRTEFSRARVMLGWLRMLVAVSWGEAQQ